MSKGIEIKVRCYSGYKGVERPCSFIIGDENLEVEEIIDRWYDPDYIYFKLRANDKNIYILKYDERDDHWELTFFSNMDV